MGSDSYDDIRRHYQPAYIKVLLIAESPPPDPGIDSSRHFYRTDKIRRDDRLFINTMKALYPEAADKTEAQLQPDKVKWLKKFQSDGWYMIEALEESLRHEITKPQRRKLIAANLPRLLARVKHVAEKSTKVILVKSNVFDVAAGPLRKAGYIVLNSELLDYPGCYNQRAYRDKLAKLATKV